MSLYIIMLKRERRNLMITKSFFYVYEDAPDTTLEQQQRTTNHQLALPKLKT